jgi:RND family efflux transporter MFP subunit
MPLRATIGGVVATVGVDEGEPVEAGQVLASLRDDEVRMRIQDAEAALAVAQREAAAGRARSDEPAAQIAQVEAQALSAKLGLLGDQLERMQLRAPLAGVVLTRRPREKVGESLEPGQTFVLLGRTDRLEVEARVAQSDIARVRRGERIRLRVPARPEYTFVGTVGEIAANADSAASGGEPTFVVRGSLENQRNLLRPGMEASAKIVGPLRPIGYILLRPLVRWAQLRFWR